MIICILYSYCTTHWALKLWIPVSWIRYINSILSNVYCAVHTPRAAIPSGMYAHPHIWKPTKSTCGFCMKNAWTHHTGAISTIQFFACFSYYIKCKWIDTLKWIGRYQVFISYRLFSIINIDSSEFTNVLSFYMNASWTQAMTSSVIFVFIAFGARQRYCDGGKERKRVNQIKIRI